MSSNKSGAWLLRYALEQLPVTHTFGIPGVHNTEIYDELNKSEKIHPVLVTHEVSAAFMADAVSRTSPRQIGVIVIVPAAGVTHAMSGIGEAYLDGIPLMIISGGTRTDIEFAYQLHQIDQLKLLASVTKGAWKVDKHSEIVPTVFQAYRLAVSGTPGPVFIEIPVNLQLFRNSIDHPAPPEPNPVDIVSSESAIDDAVSLLRAARSPCLFVGWGAVDVVQQVQQIAELLGAPVATTLQGLSAFPGNHPLHAGMGFSRAAVPAAENAFTNCDCLLAIGTRFSEIPTGSFGCRVPENLIHIDINKEVFDRNFQSKIAIEGDARAVVPKLLEQLLQQNLLDKTRRARVESQIASDKKAYQQQWRAHLTDRVNPSLFFHELRAQLADDAICVVDNGNHTFLAAELFEVRGARTFISPSDFNSMGYCVPATIGAKLANPHRQVVGVVGDGAFLMTGMELLTAAKEKVGIVCFVFHDGELSQIAQGQHVPYNRKTCTVLGQIQFEGIAIAISAKYLTIDNNACLAARIREALELAATGQPVLVNVRIDYSKRTRFNNGLIKTVLGRFPLGDKLRFVGRAFVRKVTG